MNGQGWTIDFYGKSGFRQASEYGIRYHGLPEGEDASFFLCRELIPGYFKGITGAYATSEGYLVDEQEAEEFDKQFPYKEEIMTVALHLFAKNGYEAVSVSQIARTFGMTKEALYRHYENKL